MDAIKYLAEKAQEAPGADTALSLLFLTPCHATPLYSHLHAAVPARFLDCSPPGWAPAVARLNAGGPVWHRRGSSCQGLSADGSASVDGPAPIGRCSGLEAGVRDGGQRCPPDSGAALSVASDSAVKHSRAMDPANGEVGPDPIEAAPPVAAAEAKNAQTYVAPSKLTSTQCTAETADMVAERAVTTDTVARSERQVFEIAPDAWLRAQYSPNSAGAELPTHVVLFSNQLAAVESWLSEGGYQLSQDFFHTHFAVDKGHEARVLVFTNMRA